MKRLLVPVVLMLGAFVAIPRAAAVGPVGSADRTFSSNGGTAWIEFGTNELDVAKKTLVGSDGSIFVVGTAHDGDLPTMAVVKLDSEGITDPNFGENGVRMISPRNLGLTLSDAVLVNDGVVLVGTMLGGSVDDVIVAKVDLTGDLVDGWNSSDAEFRVVPTGSSAQAISIFVLDDGSFRIAGGTKYSAGQWGPAIWALHSDGTIDTSAFPSSGRRSLRVLLPGADDGTARITSAVIQTDGKIIAGGYVEEFPQVGDVDRYALLIRFNADGTPDETFGSDGVVTHRGYGLGDYVTVADLTLQDDGRVLVAGTGAAGSSESTDGIILRFTSDGLLDPTLDSGNGFHLRVDSGVGNDAFTSVVQLQDHRIVAVGTVATSGSSKNLVVARYSENGVPDEVFGTDGVVERNLGGSEVVSSVEQQSETTLTITGGGQRTTSPNWWFVHKVVLDRINLTVASPHDPEPDETVTLTYPAGTFSPNSSIQFELVPGNIVFDAVSAESDGSLSAAVLIPEDAVVGAATILAFDADYATSSPGLDEAVAVSTPITVEGDRGDAATPINYSQPGQFDVEPCVTDADTDCIESLGYYAASGEFIEAGFLENNDPSTAICDDGHIDDRTGSFWNFPGLVNEVGSSILLVGPMIKTPNFNHSCRETRSAGGLVADQVYVSIYAANGGAQGYNQSGVSEPRTDCPEPGIGVPHTELSCTRRAGPGGDDVIEITMRISGFAPAFAYTSTTNTEVITEPLDSGGSRVTLRGKASGVPGVWDGSSFDRGSLETALQADFIEQMWSFYMANASSGDFPSACASYGFPVVAGNHAYGGQPEWNSGAGELTFNMGAPHLDPNGDPFEGHYEARIPVAYAECLWGIDPTSLVTDLEVVVEDEGVERDPTEFDASITIIGDVLHIDADGFHFSEPNVIVRSSGGSFTALTPSRIVNTRGGDKVGAMNGSGAPLKVKVTGVGDVPSSGVAAVALNVTVTGTEGPGYVTVYPCGTRPDASNLNFVSGQTVPNAVIAPVSSAGEVCFFVKGKAHILADISGYFSSGFDALTPSRIVNTRGGSKVGAMNGSGAPLKVKVTGVGDVPSSGVAAVALNVTVTGTEGPGYVTVYPCGTRPDASNLNFVSGQTVPNAVIAPVSSGGEVCFFVKGKAHILADISGYFSSGFDALTPSRIVNTRGGSKVGAMNGSGAPLKVKVTGVGDVPSSGVAAVALNVTVTGTEGPGYVTVYPCGTRPDASNLNFVTGQTVPNAVIAPVSSAGEVCFFVKGKAHILADISGYFSS